MSKVRKALKVQQKIEGYTPETALLLKVAKIVQFQSEWSALTTAAEHRYGKLSYECNTFYYPSDLLTNLLKINDVPNWQGQKE